MPPEQTLIAFGSARFSSSSRGYEPGAVKAFRALLPQYGHRIETQEFRTSITCSRCHSATHDARLPCKPEPLTQEESQRDDPLRWQAHFRTKVLQASSLLHGP